MFVGNNSKTFNKHLKILKIFFFTPSPFFFSLFRSIHRGKKNFFVTFRYIMIYLGYTFIKGKCYDGKNIKMGKFSRS